MSGKADSITVEALLAEQQWLSGLARRLVRDEARADDLLQDIWLRVVTSPPRAVRSVRGWLTTVLVNRLRDTRRSETRRTVREDAAADCRDAPATADIVARVDAQRRVVTAVLELEEPLRETILLRFYEDLPVRGIARRMEVPYETARARVKRGLEILRTRLGRRDERGVREWSVGFLALAGIGAPKTTTVAAGATLLGGLLAVKSKLFLIALVLIALAVGIGTVNLLSPSSPDAPGEPPPETVATAREVPTGEELDSAGTTPGPDAASPGTERPDESPDPERGACHGRISRADGSPAVGVLVRLSGRPARVVRTDDDGRYRIENEWVDPSGRTLGVGPPTGAVSLGVVPLRAGAEVEFDAVLPAGKPLDVEVVSAVDGRALPGVWVLFEPLAEPAFPNALVITGEDGKGRVGELPPRDYRVSVVSQGFAPHRERLDRTNGASVGRLRIALEDPEELIVRIVPPPRGKKLWANVSILPVPADPVQGQYFVGSYVSEDGVIRGAAPPPGRYRAHVEVYGVLRKMVEGIVVREREPVEIVIETDPGVEIRGVLVGPDGEALRGTIEISTRVPGVATGKQGARTNAKGEFAITGFPPGSSWVTVRLPGQYLSEVIPDLLVGEGGIPDLRVVLPSGGRIKGRITGSPIPNSHSVNFFRKQEDGNFRFKSSSSTDAHGGFQAAYLVPGAYRLTAGSFHTDLGWAEVVDVDITSETKLEDLEIAWRKNPEVVLVVTDAGGTAVTEPVVGTAIPRGVGTAGNMLRNLAFTPDRDGRAVLRSLAPGRYYLHLETKGSPARTAALEVEVKDGENPPLVIRLED